MVAAPAFSDSVRLSLWTDVLREESGRAGLVSEEKKKQHIHSLVGIVEQSCSVLFPWASLGLSNRRKCHSFTLCFYIKERVGCMI